MEYVEPQPAERDELAQALSRGDKHRTAEALIGLVFHDPDWKWLQEQCVEFLEHPDPENRGLAVTSLGHIARIHGTLDSNVVKRLQSLLDDPTLAGRVQDALNDIEMFAAGE
ncbi:MAG: hypothetical protein LBV34_24670 [Nocardiopsaceae bacterium]|nr:hypothetical protein [Nocardiopsaceae bacterium]